MLNLTSFRLLPILLFAFFALSAKAQVSLFEGDTVFVVVDQKPTFPGGFEGVQKFIRKNSRLKVTSAKRRKNLVVVQAFCTKEGKLIINLLEYRGKEASHKESVYKEEARRLIENMPKWTPGKKEGRVVVATTVLSFKFR